MATTLNNSATISYVYGTTNDASTSNLVTTQLEENYSLKAEKTSNNTTWRPQENITFNLLVENDGTEPLYGVSIQDDLGAGTLNYIPGSARMFRNEELTGIAPTNVSPLTMVIPDPLEAGEVVLLSYVAKVKGDLSSTVETITNTATVVGHEVSAAGTAVPVNPSPTLTLTKEDYANVRIEKTVDKENVAVGEELTYTFRLENSGNTVANRVVLRDDLPDNFEITSVTSITDGVETIFEPTDYSVGENNVLILPTSTTKLISVPASTISGDGLTIVTIVGTITE